MQKPITLLKAENGFNFSFEGKFHSPKQNYLRGLLWPPMQ